MYPTGDDAQTDTVTMTLTIPCLRDGVSNDFILSAVRNQLVQLTNVGIWDDSKTTITAAQAAAYAQAVYDSLTLT